MTSVRDDKKKGEGRRKSRARSLISDLALGNTNDINQVRVRATDELEMQPTVQEEGSGMRCAAAWTAHSPERKGKGNKEMFPPKLTHICAHVSSDHGALPQISRSLREDKHGQLSLLSYAIPTPTAN